MISQNDVSQWRSLSGDAQIEYLENLCGGSSTKWEQWRKLCQNSQRRRFPYYYYMITFTLDPSKPGFGTDPYYDKVEKYIRKLIQNKGWEPLYIAIVREGGDEDHKHTHWHVCFVSHCWFDSKNIAYYKKLYGSVDISTTHSQNIFNTIKYMNKQRQPDILLHSSLVRNLDPNDNSQIALK